MKKNAAMLRSRLDQQEGVLNKQSMEMLEKYENGRKMSQQQQAQF